MSYGEYLSWAMYANKCGSLNNGLRGERSLALVAAQFASAFLKKKDGGSFSMDDFSLYSPKTPDKEATPMDVFNLMQQVAVNKDVK